MANDRLNTILGAIAAAITIAAILAIFILAYKRRARQHSAAGLPFDADDEAPNSRPIPLHPVMRPPVLVVPMPPNVLLLGNGAIYGGLQGASSRCYGRNWPQVLDRIPERTEETGHDGGVGDESVDTLPRYRTPPPPYRSSQDGNGVRGESAS